METEALVRKDQLGLVDGSGAKCRIGGSAQSQMCGPTANFHRLLFCTVINSTLFSPKHVVVWIIQYIYWTNFSFLFKFKS